MVLSTTRPCRVSVPTADGVTHAVTVQATTLFEAAAAAVAQMREEGWSGALAPDAVLRVEVQLPPVIHDVPLKALQRWADQPSVSPKQELLKRPLRRFGEQSRG